MPSSANSCLVHFVEQHFLSEIRRCDLSQIADSACPFCVGVSQCKKAFHDACRTSSEDSLC